MLTPERWKEIESLFDEALDRPAAERDAWLRARCADDHELLAQVRELLEAESSDRFERPAALDAADLVSRGLADPLEGRVLGPYRLGDEIGRGGMGIVYRARREDGEFQQDVVIKLLRIGIDDAVGQARFRRERQILAQLRHENIARLLDGGVAPDGRPYIAMEPVDGDRIDDWCDARGATIHERVELFLQVVDAIHYAQQNLIVHRDLKPSNVLVTGNGTVKLLDFGIAKILSDDEDAATQTQSGLMTPDYASPEQVRGEPVTVASDVYQLGVLLYSLLTGVLPYDLGSRSVYDVSRAVCQTEPTLASRAPGTGRSRQETDDRDATAILRSRRTDSRSLRRALSGDLDSILLRCLQKDPSRRYESARALGQDLRSYLDGRPVEARDGDLRYRAGKFVGRHRVAVASAFVAIAVLVGMVAFHTDRVTRERDRAQREAAEKQEITDFLVEMFDESDATATGDQAVTARTLLERALARIEAEDRAPTVTARMLVAVGKAALKLGLNDEALDVLERAYTMNRDLHGPESLEFADAANQLGHLHRAMRRFDDARPYYRTAAAVLEDRGEPVELATCLGHLAECQRDTGDPEVALATIRRARAILSRHVSADSPEALQAMGVEAYILRRLERVDEAEDLYRRAILTCRSAEEPPLETLTIQLNNLAYLLKQSERAEEAIPLYREALDLRVGLSGEDHPITLTLQNNLIGALTTIGHYDDAVALGRERAALVAARFGDTHWRVGSAHHSRGRVLVEAERFEDAGSAFAESIEVWNQGLGEDHGWVAVSRLWIGVTHLLRGDRATYDRARRDALPRTIETIENMFVGAAFVHAQETLRAHGHDDLADENERMRREFYEITATDR